MGNIKKLKSGKYQIRIYIGKDEQKHSRFKKFTCNTIRECKAKERECLVDLEQEKTYERPNLTVGTAVELYINSVSNVLAPSTIRGYTINLKNKFKDIANIPLRELTQLDLQSSINTESFISSPKTVKNIYSLVIQVLKKYKIEFEVTYPKKKKPKLNVPDSRTVYKLIKYSENTEMELPIKLAAMCGLRRSEICALEWSDIDFKKGMLSVSKAIVLNKHNEWVLKSTKSDAGERIVPIPDSLLLRFKELRNSGKTSDLNPAQISLRFSKIQKHISKKHIRFHDLRHYFASIALALGIPDKYTIEMTGHADIEVLKDTYQHTFDDDRTRFYSLLNNYFNKAINSGVPIGVPAPKKDD